MPTNVESALTATTYALERAYRFIGPPSLSLPVAKLLLDPPQYIALPPTGKGRLAARGACPDAAGAGRTPPLSIFLAESLVGRALTEIGLHRNAWTFGLFNSVTILALPIARSWATRSGCGAGM